MLNTKQKLIPLAIAAAFGLQAQATLALPIQLSLSAETTASSNNTSDSNSYTPNSNSIYSHSHASYNDSSASSHAGGNTSGWFYSSAYSYGSNASAGSTFTQSYSITNDTGLTQLLDFNFKVNGGSLYANTSNLVSANSGYNAKILLNNTIIWSSSALLQKNSNGIQFTQSGTALGNYSTGTNEYNWSTQDFDMALGQIAAGDTYNLKYIVNTFSSVDGQPGNPDCYSYIDSEINVEIEGYGCISEDGSVARFGDPNGVNTTPVVTITSTAVNPVNEPASIALVGAGLAGLAFMRRRKDKKA